MNCRKARSIISLVIDGEASSKERSSLQFHIMGCPSCKRLFDMSGDISAHMENLPAPVPPADLEANVLLKLEKQKTGKSTKRSPLYFIIAATLSLFAVFTTAILTTNENFSSIDVAAQNSIAAEVSIDSMMYTAGEEAPVSDISKVDVHPLPIAMHRQDDKRSSLSQAIKYSIRTAPPVRYSRRSCMISF